MLLLEDLLGIADPEVALAKIDPDARRRRLTALVNAASLARQAPAVYVVEDVHWIDEVSESMLADFLTVVPQTPSLVLISYRPEYRGALSQVPGAQSIAPGAAERFGDRSAGYPSCSGPDPSVGGLATMIAERAAGNPFFVEEMVRDLAERGVLTGARGNYVCQVDHADAAVPATLQATIAARIDRLILAAKQALNAAAVIGLRFDAEQLALLAGEAEMGELIAAELVDQVRFTPHAEYAFHHPLIRTVAYETQLKSDRVELHRRLATAIEQRHPDSLEENAALIAEHFEAADDLRAAFGWHMRAGAWAQSRDIRAARNSWERARTVADRLPTDDPGRASMRIAPRTLLCINTARVAGSIADTGFDELRDLCSAAGDTVSLAIGMAGLVTALVFHHRYREAARLASDFRRLLESIADPPLTLDFVPEQCPCGTQARQPKVCAWRSASSTWPKAIPPRAVWAPSGHRWRWRSSCVATADIPSAFQAGGKTSIRPSRWPAASTRRAITSPCCISTASPSMPGRCSPTLRLTGTPPKRWRWPSIPAMTTRWMPPG